LVSDESDATLDGETELKTKAAETKVELIEVFLAWLDALFTRDMGKSSKPSREGGRTPSPRGITLLSPYIFKMCIAGIIVKIYQVYFMGFTDVSYIAYTDDILPISRCKPSLSCTVQRVKKGFLDIGLNLDLEKCKYICFNSTLPNTPLKIKNTSIPSVENFWWLG